MILRASQAVLGGVLAVACALFVGAASAENVPEPDGFRSAPYRAPVPATLTGATVLTTDEAHRVWKAGEAVFVDVLPRPERPEDLPEGTLWNPPKRETVPGSFWLPNTGYDKLTPEREAYLVAGLESVSDGNLDAPLVFMCRSECWMSWNAAKRALNLGYTNVNWFPDGTDGWTEDGHPVETKEPMNLPAKS
ncbi:MAG: PQQ-dependent catabolism-associated CXXCW motif protein [Pseudomonadota bacterium]